MAIPGGKKKNNTPQPAGNIMLRFRNLARKGTWWSVVKNQPRIRLALDNSLACLKETEPGSFPPGSISRHQKTPHWRYFQVYFPCIFDQLRSFIMFYPWICRWLQLWSFYPWVIGYRRLTIFSWECDSSPRFWNVPECTVWLFNVAMEKHHFS